MTLYYPQLNSGAVAQYRVKRRNSRRTALNDLPGGARITYADTGASSVSWDLRYQSLTISEYAQIESLFSACSGQVGTFIFLDPLDNLLQWSEDLTQSIWTFDPLLTVTAGIADPLGGTGGFSLANVGQSSQTMSQQLPANSGGAYCFSAWLRADQAGAAATLFRTGSGETAAETLAVSSTWTRYVQTASLSNALQGLSFGVQLPAGGVVQAFGFQLEAQTSPGTYKKTLNQAGVYANARFASDSLAARSRRRE